MTRSIPRIDEIADMADKDTDTNADKRDETPQDGGTSGKDEQKKKESDPASRPPPERPTEKEPHPTKGEGRRGNVQIPPEEQRGKPDPKQRD